MQVSKKKELIESLEGIYNRSHDGDIITIVDALLEILEKEIKSEEDEL